MALLPTRSSKPRPRRADGGIVGGGRSIGDVVKLITSIAEQTNLLALNEPSRQRARATQARGFAVVAKEVKTWRLN